MIWATVGSRSWFCWLYSASPSLTAKTRINLIVVLTIWWCPCAECSLVLLEEDVCYDQCVLMAKLLGFTLVYFLFQSQICLLLQVSLGFLLLHSSPLWWNEHLFGVLIIEGLVGLHRTVIITDGHRLGLLWYWMARLGNEQRSFCSCWESVLLGETAYSFFFLLKFPFTKSSVNIWHYDTSRW